MSIVMPSVHRMILTEMLSIPTAPFAEHMVIDHIERFVARRKNTRLSRDRAGNVLVHVKQGRRTVKRPVCITAHLDHPGFVAEKMTTRSRLRAFWRGGVPKEYFVGAKVRFFTEGKWVRGVIRSITTAMREGRERVDRAMIEMRGAVGPGSVGMWDFPDPQIRGSRIHARGCDDMAGASAMLCAMDELTRVPRACEAYFLFTRAEEVGFVGAIAAARAGTIPKKCYVVAMETSSERPHAKMGDGPILRVGDRASTFTPAVTAHCHRIARELARDDKRFIYQRKLMDGGTCESSAFCTLGYDATGICIALGNYHNVNARRGKLGPEYVDLNDFENVVKWFVELARTPVPYTGRDETLRAQLKELERNYRTLLRDSRDEPC
jgi:putative aminopeptidase FrvX